MAVRATSIHHICRNIFGMEPHQVRHLMETFNYRTISEQFLICDGYASKIARVLGVPYRHRGRKLHGVNGHPGVSAWRTPEPIRNFSRKAA